MSAVSEIARAVNAAEPLEEVLNRVAAQACELIGFEFCAVMLADEQRQRLHIGGCSGLSPHYLAQVSGGRSLQIHPPGAALDTPAARAYREDRTIVVPDVRDAASYGRLQDLAPTQGYQALLASPLRGSGEKAGVIVAYSVTAREFGPPELELIELLGGQAALALETTRLRAEQQEVIRELSRANDQLRRGRAVLEWAEQQHHQLMQLVLDEVELPGLVGALATALRASVTVEDADGRMLARAPEQDYRPPPDLAARRVGPVRAALDNGEVGGRYQVVRVPGGTAAWAAPGRRGWSGAASWRGGSGSPRPQQSPSRSSCASSSGSRWSWRCCCCNNGTSMTCGAGCPATCLVTCCARVARSTPGRCWTGPRPSGTTWPGRTWSRCWPWTAWSRPRHGCPSSCARRPSRGRSRWSAPTTGCTYYCTQPNPIRATRCVASSPRRPRRRAGAGWSRWWPAQ